MAVSLSQTQALFLSAGKGKPALSLQNAAPSQTRTKLSALAHAYGSLSFNCSGQKSSFAYNPFRFSVQEKRKSRRGSGAVCSAAPLTVQNLQWISAIANAILMIVRGTSIHKSFLVPLFALQAPVFIISWIKGDYGLWSAFLALLVRLFFHIPGELELPFLALLLVIVAPHQVMNLRETQRGAIISMIVAAYLAFQHFSRIGRLQNAFDQGSIIPTIAIICVTAVSLFLLI
ncbi:hypothetical protein SLE2022_387980 [Rubroshorea leprosula]